MAKGEKVQSSSNSSSDEYDSCDENIEQLEATMIKKFGKKAYTKIKMLMKKLEKRDRCVEIQGDIITQEREKNQALEASITEEKLKVEKLTVELSLANDSIAKLTKEHSSINDQIASLKNEKSIAQESLTRLEENIKILSKTIALFGLALQLLLRQPKTLMSPLAMVVKDAIKLM
jgi:chromosome segregation ATPase